MRCRVFLLLFALCACSTAEEAPRDLLPREKFTEVLMETQLVEARMQHESVIDKRADMPVKEYYAEMFKSQGVSEASFKTTFQWYAEHPADLKNVYSDILTRLQRRADVADSTAGGH